MKIRNQHTISLYLIISIFTISLSSTCSAKIYQWTDDKGRIHFDNNGANPARKTFESKTKIQTIEWQSKKVTFHQTKKRKNKQQKSYQKDQYKKCVKTKKRLRKILASMKRPLIAEKFDAFQAELRELRWEQRKVC